MAISQRELYIVLRARDEASRILGAAAGNIGKMSAASRAAAEAHLAQGKALLTIGAATTLVGALEVKWLADSVGAAIKYNQQTALTLTQVDKVGVSLKTVGDIGKDVANTIPVPFKEMQGGLYDIFSSMDVSVPQAQLLLTEFSKAAVAGQVDLQTASRATISVMNAWHMPATDVNKVNDIMFKLVQKGVGTYDQFASSIGRAIPSTVRAGGAFKDLAGMMAFMTRNGLSTAQAATSAGRAFDAISNSKTEQHFKDIGLSVKDANGNFKPMVQIIGELHEKFKNLTKPQLAAALQQLFLGSGGTIQARRFFDLAIPGYTQLNKLTGDMANSKGAMAQAYDTMFNQPQSQIQLLDNKFQIFRVTIGEALIPVAMKLVDTGMKILDMWNSLNPGTQKAIAITLAITAALTVLIGIVTMVAGAWLMFMGAAALAGVAMTTVIGIIILVVAAFITLVAIVYYVIKYHQQIWDFIVMIWGKILAFLKQYWTLIVGFLIGGFLGLIIAAVIKYHTQILNAIQAAWNAILNLIKAHWLLIAAFLTGGLVALVASVIKFHSQIVAGFTAAWNAVKAVTTAAFNAVKSLITSAMNAVANTVKSKIAQVVSFFRSLPGLIRGAIPSPGSLLSGIGAQIINGLVSGIQAGIGKVKSVLGSVTSLIPSWKGPPDKDKKLLYNAGQLTMQGYNDGISKMIPVIKSNLQGFTAQVNAMSPTSPVGFGGTQTSGSQAPMAGVQQSFYITTNEIDPKKHAADLGYEIAKRVA